MLKLKNIFPVAIGLILVASSIFAFGPAPTPAPTCDPATTPGCNPPINVGTIGQIKNGNLGLGGNFGLSSSSFIDFNSTVAGRTATAVEGKITYDTSTTSLKIYGAGTSPNRKVTIYDKICDSVGACKSVSDIVNGGSGGSESYTATGVYGRIYAPVDPTSPFPLIPHCLNPYPRTDASRSSANGAIEPAYCAVDGGGGSYSPACRNGFTLVETGRTYSLTITEPTGSPYPSAGGTPVLNVTGKYFACVKQ